MRTVFFIIIGVIVFLVIKGNMNNTSQSEPVKTEKSLTVVSKTFKANGNPGEGYVIAEVRNNSSEPVKYVEMNVIWRNKAGNIIDSGTGVERNFAPYQTKAIDRFFTGIPEGSTYTVEVE